MQTIALKFLFLYNLKKQKLEVLMKKEKKLPLVAYFCMEYGLSSDFRIYAGGLGILAGDYLKGAKEYDFPMVALGLKWKQGYTDQFIGKDGKPYDSYNNKIYPFLEDTGHHVDVLIRDRNVRCQIWKCTSFDNVDLYLLDTDLPENEDAWITGQLYGWFGEERIAQEMVLGIGGVKALRKLGIKAEIYHFNEGHAVLAATELIREKTEKGLAFAKALEKTQKEVVFTTHTPIVQGNESHYVDRLKYMGAFNGLTTEQMVQLGGAPFNMTVAALHTSKKSNAVSQLHAETANSMWANVEFNKPILGITNAIHLDTWVDPSMVSGAKNGSNLLKLHAVHKRALIEFVKTRTGQSLNEDQLLIGFGRRAAPYKRSNLIFKDESLMGPLLKSGKVQIIFSGKAHPLDDTGKAIITELFTYTKKYPNSVVYLENYDMEIASYMTKGSDIWLNNPVRPLEASGTSGMKAAMNGVPNFSVLDGWWPEVCTHGHNGWEIGDGLEFRTWAEHDDNDLTSLYKTLTTEILPTYYDNKNRWQEIMKNSILDTVEAFGVKRMLDEYYERLYMA